MLGRPAHLVHLVTESPKGLPLVLPGRPSIIDVVKDAWAARPPGSSGDGVTKETAAGASGAARSRAHGAPSDVVKETWAALLPGSSGDGVTKGAAAGAGACAGGGAAGARPRAGGVAPGSADDAAMRAAADAAEEVVEMTAAVAGAAPTAPWRQPQPPPATVVSAAELDMLKAHRSEVARGRISGPALTRLPIGVSAEGQEIHRSEAERKEKREQERRFRRAGLRR